MAFDVQLRNPGSGFDVALSSVVAPDAFTFTGTDGQPWHPDWVFTVGSGDILTNRGRMVTGTGAFDGTAVYYDTGLADHDVRIDVEIPTTDQQFPEIRFRFASSGDFIRLLIEPHNDIAQLHPFTGYSIGSQIGSNIAFPFTAGDIVHMRVAAVGTDHRIKLWSNADPEPSSWTRQFTTSVGAGNTEVMIRTVTGSMGVAITNYWDNFSFTTANFVEPVIDNMLIGLDAGIFPTPDFMELFTASNGTSWDGDWTVTLNGGTCDVQSNRGRMVTAATAFFEVDAELTGHPVADFDLYVDLLIDANTFTFPIIYYRQNSTGAGSDDYFRIAYAVQSDEFYVEKYVGFSLSATPGGPVTKTTVPGDVLHIRLQADGTLHRAKAWVNNAPEPASWDWSFTDAFNQTETRITLGHQTGSALANRCDWDHVYVYDL